MKKTIGKVEEIYLDGSIRIVCPPESIPSPGQYLQAHAHGSDSPVAVSLFPSLVAPNGFRSGPINHAKWRPGDALHLHGPFGRGFTLSLSARRVLLVSFDAPPFHMLGLISQALAQQAEVVMVCDFGIENLPEVVEVQPLRSLPEVFSWADYAAMDVDRANLDQLKVSLAGLDQASVRIEAQVLLRSPMPCAGLADCGVCAYTSPQGWQMICKNGPVFDLGKLL